MKIYIIPKVLETYTNQIELSVDFKLIEFLKYLKPKSKIEILYFKKKIEENSLIVFSGGNNIIKFSSTLADKFRYKLDNHYFNFSKENNFNIKILGICHGAQFLSYKFGANLKKINNNLHTKQHKIIIENKKLIVNSYHNIIIKNLKNNFKILAKGEDDTIESFVHKKFKIMGIIWHPERYKKFKNFDKKLINTYL